MRSRSISMFLGLAGTSLLLLQVHAATQTAVVPQDPGPRPGAAGAGNPLPGLTAQQLAFFEAGRAEFNESEEIADGLGPRLNLDSCVGCHSQPASGGSSPPVNPQVAFATAGGVDILPPFLTSHGPVREARFVRNADGSADGGVHALFTISGRAGANGCSMTQPDFAGASANNNVVFRIPTPVFGAGLIEMIPDSAIVAGAQVTASARAALGIRGRPNFHVSGRTITGQTNNNGNDGTIARFGWKAQNKSLLLFAGEAYNVEMGVTNELFPTERDEVAGCQNSPGPNSVTEMEAATPIDATSAIEKFSVFMRLLAPPLPSPDTPGGAASIASGKAIFSSVGCALCHTASMRTGAARLPMLATKVVPLYSDLLLHDMGVGLADGVSQGEASGREFRTAPLWGLGQRLFFLHDGRASDLVAAIAAHKSTGSEASGVVGNVQQLTPRQKQDLLNFLRSL
ncbi:MAG TPA: di-heme oxidoredictase family protein [Vicinamibacterales bacterium]|jgi:CxxC motif-containing protein (DUF1111 family)